MWYKKLQGVENGEKKRIFSNQMVRAFGRSATIGLKNAWLIRYRVKDGLKNASPDGDSGGYLAGGIKPGLIPALRCLSHCFNSVTFSLISLVSSKLS
jgi:hypothetical protein